MPEMFARVKNGVPASELPSLLCAVIAIWLGARADLLSRATGRARAHCPPCSRGSRAVFDPRSWRWDRLLK